MITSKKDALKEIKKVSADYGDIAPEFWADKEFVMKAVGLFARAYFYASEEMKHDKEVALLAVKTDAEYRRSMMHSRIIFERKWDFKSIPLELRNDVEFMREVLKISWWNFRYAGDAVKDDYETVKNVLENLHQAYRYASDRLKEDKELAIFALSKNRLNYNYMTEQLREDKDIVIASVHHTMFEKRSEEHKYLSLVPKKYFDDRDFVLEMIKVHVPIHEISIPEFMLNNKEDILSMLEGGVPAEYIGKVIPSELRRDIDFAKKAVKINADLYGFLSEEIRKDKDILLEAVSKNSDVIIHALFELEEEDRALVLQIVKSNGDLLNSKFLSKFRNDKEIALNAILSEKTHCVYECLSDDLKKDKEIVLAAISFSRNITNVHHENSELFDNEDFMKEAMMINQSVFRYASPRLRCNKKFLVSIQPYVVFEYAGFVHIEEAVKAHFSDKKFILKVIKHSPEWFKYVSDDFKNNREFVQKAILVNPKIQVYCKASVVRPDIEFYRNKEISRFAEK